MIEVITNIREKLGRFMAIGMVAGLLTISLAACGGNDATATPPPAPTATATTAAESTPTDTGSTSGGTMQEVNADLKEWSVSLNSADVSAGKVKYTVTNDGQMPHDLVVLDADGNKVGGTTTFKSSDGPQTLEVDLKTGTYTFLCDLPGHAEQGMKTTVTVK